MTYLKYTVLYSAFLRKKLEDKKMVDRHNAVNTELLQINIKFIWDMINKIQKFQVDNNVITV